MTYNIITDLQRDLSDTSNKLSDILPKAYLLAQKLNLDDFANWIKNEMNGYASIKHEDYPFYRKMNGIVKANNPLRGWEQICFSSCPEIEEKISKTTNNQSIVELENLLYRDKNSDLAMPLPSSFSKSLQYPLPCAIFIDRSHLVGIINKVRIRLLDWAIALEKEGIKGVDMSFLDAEIKKAKDTVPSTIINNFNGDTQHFQMAQGNETVIQNQDNKKPNGLFSTVCSWIKKIFTWWKQ